MRLLSAALALLVAVSMLEPAATAAPVSAAEVRAQKGQEKKRLSLGLATPFVRLGSTNSNLAAPDQLYVDAMDRVHVVARKPCVAKDRGVVVFD